MLVAMLQCSAIVYIIYLFRKLQASNVCVIYRISNFITSLQLA